jgi:hypothetical protein
MARLNPCPSFDGLTVALRSVHVSAGLVEVLLLNDARRAR